MAGGGGMISRSGVFGKLGRDGIRAAPAPPLRTSPPMLELRASWGGSSAGRASRSQCEGRGFDPLPLHHYPPSEKPSVDSREISEGVVLDYDSAGELAGIDTDNASGKVELKRLLLSNLPGKVETATA